MAGQHDKIHIEQGAERLVAASGGSIDVESGGEIDVESGGSLKLADTAISSTAAELNILDGVTADKDDLNALDEAPIGTPTFVIGSEAANVINVAVQLTKGDGTDLAVRGSVFVYLSDDANGDSIAATAPDGNVAIGTDGVWMSMIADKAGWVTSESDGDIDRDIGEAAGATWYLIVVLPNGKLVASSAITFAA